MRNIYIVSGITALAWFLMWVHHKIRSGLPHSDINNRAITETLSKSPRWQKLQESMDWDTRWTEARQKGTPARSTTRGKVIRSGRFSN